MVTLKEEIQKIMMQTVIALEKKNAAPVNPRTALNLYKIFKESIKSHRQTQNQT